MRQRRPGRALLWFVLGSLALHAGLLAAFLLLADRAGRGAADAADASPTVELVMVEQKGHGQTTGQAPPAPDQTAKDAPSVPAAAAPPPAPPPVPHDQQAPAASNVPPAPAPTPPPAPAEEEAEALPLPPPPSPVPPPPKPASSGTPTPTQSQVAARETPPLPPSPAAHTPSPASAAPPAPNVDSTPRINLGGTDSLSNILVEGDQVIPAGPDPKVHNREPIYPDEAARRGEHGVVVLEIRVSPEGLVSGVDIAHSSGFRLLDRAAREAVLTWRFVPAVRDGQPIPSSMPLRVEFQLD